METTTATIVFLSTAVIGLVLLVVLLSHRFEGMILDVIDRYSRHSRPYFSHIRKRLLSLKATNLQVFEHYGVSVKLIETSEQCVRGIEQLLSNNPRILGFDCEWKPYFGDTGAKNPVSLLQLSDHHICLLIRLKNIFESAQGVPKELVALLIDPTIIKTGLNISGDAKKLYEDYNLQVRGCVELTHLIKQKCKFYAWLQQQIESRQRSLRQLQTPKMTNMPLSSIHIDRLDGLAWLLLKELNMQKNKKITMSNWELDPLSPQQIKYAANDAILSFYIFVQCVCNLDNTDSIETSHISEFNFNTNKPLISVDFIDTLVQSRDVLKICYGIIDSKILKLERKVDKQNSSPRPSSSCIGDGTPTRCSARELEKLERKKKFADAMSRKKPLYDNCKLRKKDGTLIATCSQRTLEWYLKKGIATQDPNDSKSILLKFEPSTERNSSDSFYQTTKQNICVVCGNDKSLVRYYIVPQCYRKLFPKKFKDHSSHDIVLICNFDCHAKANAHEERVKQNISERFNITKWNDSAMNMWAGADDQFEEKVEVSRCATILINLDQKPCHKDENVPQERRNRLLAVLARYYGLRKDVNEMNEIEAQGGACEVHAETDSEMKKDTHGMDDIDWKLYKIEDVNDEMIKKARQLIPSRKELQQMQKNIFQKHCKELVQSYQGDYHALIREWRQAFVDNMNPQFLSKHWSVDSEY